MSTKHHAFPLRDHIVLTTTGSFDFIGSKLALKAVALEPSLSAQKEILLDLRDVDCKMSTFDTFELAQHLAFPNPALDTNKKIAVVIGGSEYFNHAQFMELCARNRNVNIRAFADLDAADKWLYGDSPPER